MVNTLTRSPQCYTQGLEWDESRGLLYQSCGIYGKSSLQLVKLEKGTATVVKETRLRRKYFAEGITRYKDEILMLTWREKEILIFDAGTLALKRTAPLRTTNGEGWGLTQDLGEKMGQTVLVFASTRGHKLYVQT